MKNLIRFPKKMFMLLAVLLLLGSLSRPFFSPEPIEANPPADVFTGQIVPAFIGAEYDPTLAFQDLAGATIYVFAYDNWSITNPHVVVGNIIVKTQIRADGSFVAMGLPHATYYGIYFPYNQEGPIEGAAYNGIGTGCGATSQGPAGGACVYPRPQGSTGPAVFYDNPSSPVAGSLQMTHFRTPESDPANLVNDDKIADIFSYSLIEYDRTFANPVDQLGQEVNLNNTSAGGKKIFVTSSNKLDIENHVNVFPVVPTSVLNFSINTFNYGSTATDGGSGAIILSNAIYRKPVTVTATRIAYYRHPWAVESITLPTNYLYADGPTITGKTDNLGTFKTYAPAGYYKISYSFEGDDNIAFKEVDPLGENPTFIDGTNRQAVIDRSKWKLSLNGVIDGYQIYRSGSHVWGIVSQMEAVEGSDTEYSIKIPASSIGVYLETDTVSDGGALARRDYDPVIFFGNNRLMGGPVNYMETNALGVYYFRTSNVYTPISGSIKLVESETETTVGPASADGNLYDQQTHSIAGIGAGIQTADFSLIQKPTQGFLLTVIDSNKSPVSSATVTLSSRDNSINSKSFANKKASYVTNDYGQVYLSPNIFIESAEALDSGSCPDAVISDYIVIASLGQNFKALLNLTVANICNSFDTLITTDDSNNLFIKPPETNISTRNPGFIQLAQFLQFNNFIKVQAEDIKMQCYLTNTGGTAVVPFLGDSMTPRSTEYPGIPLMGMNGTLTGKVTEKVIVMAVVDTVSQVFYVSQGVETDDPSTLNAAYKPGLFYNKESGVAHLDVPCGPGNWVIKVEAGDEMAENLVGNANATADSGLELTGGKQAMYGFRTFVNWTFNGFNIDEAKTTTNQHYNQLWTKDSGTGDTLNAGAIVLTQNLTQGSSRRSATVELSVKDVGSTTLPGYYSPTPAQLVFGLQPGCGDITLTDFSISTIMNNFVCIASGGIAKVTEDTFTFLEDTILHTPPISSIPTATYLWNIMRNIANGIAIIFILYFAIRYMFRLDSKDLPLNTLPIRLAKGVVFANLSLLYCQLFIDIANIATRAVFASIHNSFMQQLASGGGMQTTMGGVGIASMGVVIGSFIASAGGGAAIGAGTAAAATAAAGGSFALGPAVLMLLVSIGGAILMFVGIVVVQFLLRLTVIYVCVVIAPIKDILAIIPESEGFIKLWNGVFFAFVFMQTIAALLLGIGSSLISYLPSGGSTIMKISQLLIGVAVTFVTIKSPGMLLGLLGGGALAGKAFTGLGEKLGEAQGGVKEHFGTEQVAMRAAERGQAEKLGLASKSPIGRGLALVGIRPGGSAAKATRAGRMQAIQTANQDRYAQSAGLQQETDNRTRQSNVALLSPSEKAPQKVTRNATPADKMKVAQENQDITVANRGVKDRTAVVRKLQDEARQNNYATPEAQAQYVRDTYSTYDTMPDNASLNLDTTQRDSGYTGKTYQTLIQEHNADLENRQVQTVTLQDTDYDGYLSSFNNTQFTAMDPRLSSYGNYTGLQQAAAKGDMKAKNGVNSLRSKIKSNPAIVQKIKQQTASAQVSSQKIDDKPGRVKMSGKQAGSLAQYVTRTYGSVNKAAEGTDSSATGAWTASAFERDAENQRLRTQRQRQHAAPPVGTPGMTSDPYTQQMMYGNLQNPTGKK